MLNNSQAYALVIRGCPVIFTTPGTRQAGSGLSTGNPFDQETIISLTNTIGWGEHGVPLIAEGTLDPTSLGEFSEEIDLLNHEFNADGMTFRIFDIPIEFGDMFSGIERRNIASFLFTKTDQITAQLSQSITASYTGGRLKFRGNTNYPSVGSNFVFWIDGEAFNGIVNSPSDEIEYTRRIYRTQPEDHFVLSGSNYYPTIYLQYPGCFKQKVELWKLFDTNEWKCIWRGVGGRAPRSASDGTAIELQCEHYWTDFKGKKFEVVEAKTKLAGWDSRKLSFRKYQKTGDMFSAYHAPPDRYFETPTAQNIEYNTRNYPSIYSYGLYDIFTDYNGTGEFFDGWIRTTHLENDIVDGNFSLRVPAPSQTSWRLQIFGNYGAIGAPIDSRAYRSFDLSEVPITSAEEDGAYVIKAPIPEWSAFQVFKNGALATDNNHLFIDYVNSLREFNFISSGSQNTCLTRTVWVGEIDKEDYIPQKLPTDQGFFQATSEPADTSGRAPSGGAHAARRMFYYCQSGSFNFDWQRDPSIRRNGAGRNPLYFMSGSAIFKDKNLRNINMNTETDPISETWRQIHFVMQEVELEHKISLRSRHWMDLVRYGLIERFRLSTDFDFSYRNYLRLKLENPSFATEIFLDGGQSNGEIIQAFSQFYGIVPTSTTNGQMTFCKIEKPTDVSKYDIAIAPEVYATEEKPTWENVGDNVVTSIFVNSEGFSGGKLAVFNQYSKAKYGDNQTINIDLEKIGIEDTVFQRPDPEAWVSSYVISNYLQKFLEPYTLLTFHLPLSYLDRIFPSMIVNVTDWLLPDGSGNRGIDAKNVLVVKRTVNLQEGRVSIGCVNFPGKRNYGFSPCLRVSSINAGTKTITINTGSYIATGRTEGPTDYSGANLEYYAKTANDGGLGFITVGDKIQLILRDTATWVYDTFTVAAISAGTITVSETITTSPVDWPTYATTGMLDVKFAAYDTSGIRSQQRQWCYIGDGNTRRIKSIDPIQIFSVF